MSIFSRMIPFVGVIALAGAPAFADGQEAAEDVAEAAEAVAADAADAVEGAADAVEDAAADAAEAVEGAVDDAAAEAEAAGGDPEIMAILATGDAANGQRVFRQCMACHVVEQPQNRVGPSLNGIIGRTAGTVEGFRYSPANADSGVTWTEENLFVYLENPRQFIPGTTMAFIGLRNPQQRADVIAYIRENGGVAE